MQESKLYFDSDTAITYKLFNCVYANASNLFCIALFRSILIRSSSRDKRVDAIDSTNDDNACD